MNLFEPGAQRTLRGEWVKKCLSADSTNTQETTSEMSSQFRKALMKHVFLFPSVYLMIKWLCNFATVFFVNLKVKLHHSV